MTKQPIEHDPGLSATMSEAYVKVSEKVATAYAAARDQAASAAHGTAAGLEANPLAAVAGGLALGVVVAALIPRGHRERAILAPVGARIAETAKVAFAAARSAGTDALDEAGISPEHLRAQASQLFEQALTAAGSAGTAAMDAARDASTK